jgi:hypothetical protein
VRASVATLVAISVVAVWSHSAEGRQEAKSIGGAHTRESWASVGELTGGDLFVQEGRSNEATVGMVRFADKVFRPTDIRAHMGITVARIKLRRPLPAKGYSIAWAQVGGAPYARVELFRANSSTCRNAVRWSIDDVVLGSRRGVTCRRIISVRSVNVLPNSSVRRAPRRWSFFIESPGTPLAESMWVLSRSRIGKTEASPARLVIAAPEDSEVDEDDPEFRIRLENEGGRTAKSVVVRSYTDNGDAVLTEENVRAKHISPLRPGGSRLVDVPVAPLAPGTYTLNISAEAIGTGDRLRFTYVTEGVKVGSSPNVMGCGGLLLGGGIVLILLALGPKLLTLGRSH